MAIVQFAFCLFTRGYLLPLATRGQWPWDWEQLRVFTRPQPSRVVLTTQMSGAPPRIGMIMELLWMISVIIFFILMLFLVNPVQSLSTFGHSLMEGLHSPCWESLRSSRNSSLLLIIVYGDPESMYWFVLQEIMRFSPTKDGVCCTYSFHFLPIYFISCLWGNLIGS